MTHDLKTWPTEWEAVKRGDKMFEVRSNVDRDFAVGDMLLLRKWDPGIRAYGGLGHGDYVAGAYAARDAESAETLTMRATYVLHGGRFGLAPGICVIGLAPWERA